MNKHARIKYAVLTLSLLFSTSSTWAQIKPLIRGAKNLKQQKVNIEGLRYVPQPAVASANKLVKHTAPVTPATPNTTPLPEAIYPAVVVTLPEHTPDRKAVSLSDGKNKPIGKHSIVPSAMTILGSDAFRRKEGLQIEYLRQQAEAAMNTEYLPPAERAYWTQERENLNHSWRLMEPTPPTDLFKSLTHAVPAATLEQLKDSYIQFVEDAKNANYEIMTKVVYSSLQNEAKRFSLPEKIYINTLITDMRFRTMILRNAFMKDKYLMAQQQYWEQIFCTFNPLLKGMLLKLDIPRPDKRVYDYHEFVLSNPDHSTPYLPNSRSLIQGEDEEFEDDNYGRPMPAELRAAQRAAERAHFEAMMKFTKEADALLPYIPENLRIAFINDDTNPRVNFLGWGKRGFLGKGATVSVFADGRSFMDEVRRGTQYDLVITDLLVPDGGIVMMEEFRRISPLSTVIASSKFYPGDGDTIKTNDGKEVVTTEDYFRAGLDGYMWYNNNLDTGAYGYIQYLRSMKNYYYYRNLHGWAR